MCAREGCEKPVKAKGFCVGHYSKYKLDRNKALGKPRIDYRALDRLEWTEEDLEGLWEFVKKELNIV
jgi:hypothetical protein